MVCNNFTYMKLHVLFGNVWITWPEKNGANILSTIKHDANIDILCMCINGRSHWKTWLNQAKKTYNNNSTSLGICEIWVYDFKTLYALLQLAKPTLHNIYAIYIHVLRKHWVTYSPSTCINKTLSHIQLI